MAIEVPYRGMVLEIPDQDPDNLAYFRHCADGRFHLQRCAACSLLRYPPGPACYACAHEGGSWEAVPMTGTVHSYTEVRHAIQPGFRAATPYLLLVVDLDVQRGEPSAHDALRVVGNLVTPDGELAPPEQVARVGIGSRVTMVFTPLSPGIALPNWALDGEQPAQAPWRHDR